MTQQGWAKDDIIKINLQDRKVEIVKAKGDDVVQGIDDKGQLKHRYTYGENRNDVIKSNNTIELMIDM